MEPRSVILQVGHTADLRPEVLGEARDLLALVFDGDFSHHDWEHSLGGMHVLAWCDNELLGHASVIQRRIIHNNVALRAGYVEGVGVHPDWQGQGIGGEMMNQVEYIISAAYDLGALGASDEAIAFYEHRGWIKWLGPTSTITPTGVVRTADEDGYIYVLPGPRFLDIDGELTCDWRDGDVW